MLRRADVNLFFKFDDSNLFRASSFEILIFESAVREGFEPCTQYSQLPQDQQVCDSVLEANTQIRAQIRDSLGCDLAEVVAAWPALAVPLRAAILAIVRSSTDSTEGES